MSIPRKYSVACIWIVLLLQVLAAPASAARVKPKPQPSPSATLDAAPELKEEEPLHWSGTRTLWDRRAKRVELIGSARVSRPKSLTTADRILLDLQERTVDARGSVVYQTEGVEIQSQAMKFNLDSLAGTIENGKVSDGKFRLTGDRIHRLSEKRFQTHQGEYTTCLDCPGSWSFKAEDVDFEIGGYAYLTNVMVRVRDAPILWFPYLIIPVKTDRQSGFLFPKFSIGGQHGITFVQPYYWAMGRSADMTFGLGTYSLRGLRAEWEGRYALSSESDGTANLYFTGDRTGEVGRSTRLGFQFLQRQDLGAGFSQKLKLLEVGDNRYPLQFNDFSAVGAQGDAVLGSTFSISRASPFLSAFVEAKRFRNLLNTESLSEFDPKTVQLMPRLVVTTNDQSLFSTPVHAGLTFGLSYFGRSAGAFDPDLGGTSGAAFSPGVDPLRKAVRLSFTPSIYTTLRPWGAFSVVPSFQYRSYLYSFEQAVPNLVQSYPLFQTDFSIQLERVFAPNAEGEKYKHVLRPFLKYSRIPWVRTDIDHPFVQQVKYRNGYNFDNLDIVPMGTTPSLTNYFTPLGNSISYGFVTQLLRRTGTDLFQSPQNVVELRAQQTMNLMELERDESVRIPFSRFESQLLTDQGGFTTNTQYNYYPYLDRLLPGAEDVSPHEVSTSGTWALETGFRQGIYAYDRSISLGYTYSKLSSKTSNLTATVKYSLSDYVLPSASLSYSFLTHEPLSASASLSFQSPARCWKLVITSYWQIGQPATPFTPDLTLNLTGTGFDGVSGVAGGVASSSR